MLTRIPIKESSEKLATTIASELDPEEEHHKEKSPWDMSATNEDEEIYQTEGKLVNPPLNDRIILTLTQSLFVLGPTRPSSCSRKVSPPLGLRFKPGE